MKSESSSLINNKCRHWVYENVYSRAENPEVLYMYMYVSKTKDISLDIAYDGRCSRPK